MGDYGFKGAAEFGGQDTNFHCEPRSDREQCPYVKAFANDASRSAFAEYECRAETRGKCLGDHGGPSKFYMCDAKRFENCSHYKKEQSKLERKASKPSHGNPYDAGDTTRLKRMQKRKASKPSHGNPYNAGDTTRLKRMQKVLNNLNPCRSMIGKRDPYDLSS